jgi:endogenous inhibitor of DNA gyrase (YacG/DUF329 family)
MAHDVSIAGILVECENCGDEYRERKYEYDKREEHYCSESCMGEGNRVERVTKECTECGSPVTRKESEFKCEKQFCSEECYSKNKKGEYTTSIEYSCDYCGDSTIVRGNTVDEYDNHFCSKECHGKYRSEKHQKSLTCDNCGDEFERNVGNITSNNVYCSKECFGESNRGDDNSTWTGGGNRFHQTREARVWRESVFERDDYTCQDCGERGGKLNAHHIIRVSDNEDKATDVDNGVTLCIECHAQRHEEAGETKSATLIRSNLDCSD